MNRLTEEYMGCKQIIDCGNETCEETCARVDGCKVCPIQKAIIRLSEYEDTGIDPEEIAAHPIAKVYRNHAFRPEQIEWFEKIEKALGFNLFFWQKTFLITGSFRQAGFTTAECLKELFGDEPIDYSERAKTLKEDLYRHQLLEIKERLQRAGIKTAPIFTCKKDVKEYREFLRVAKMRSDCERQSKFAWNWK